MKQIVGERARFTVVGTMTSPSTPGAAPSPQNLIAVERRFPNLRLIKLEQNYRSKRRILKVRQHPDRQQPHVYDKALFSELWMRGEAQGAVCQNEEHEAGRIAAELMDPSL